MPRITCIAVELAICLGACAVPASAQTDGGSPDCGDPVTALQQYRTFGELLLRLTRDQIQQAAESRYQIGLKAIDKGWSTSDEQAFIARFLASPEFLELEKEREPSKAVLAAAQSQWRRPSDPSALRGLCESFGPATLAIKRLHEVNQKQQAVLMRMLASQ